jgi:hypothetical protein
MFAKLHHSILPNVGMKASNIFANINLSLISTKGDNLFMVHCLQVAFMLRGGLQVAHTLGGRSTCLGGLHP